MQSLEGDVAIQAPLPRQVDQPSWESVTASALSHVNSEGDRCAAFGEAWRRS
jgi:hypothetical protein